jgi:UDPglucose--hexose-1-phosphate uridylyltransferase
MHHIKKENIGLIEVMGLAILPGRLKDELDGIADILCGDDKLAVAMQQEGHPLFKHADWIYRLNTRFGRLPDKETAVRTVQNEVGLKFSEILEHAGVYKRNPSGHQAFGRFMKQLGYTLGE